MICNISVINIFNRSSQADNDVSDPFQSRIEKSKEDICKIVVNTVASLIYPTRDHEFEPWTKMAQVQCASSACNELVWGIRNHGEACTKCG